MSKTKITELGEEMIWECGLGSGAAKIEANSGFVAMVISTSRQKGGDKKKKWRQTYMTCGE